MVSTAFIDNLSCDSVIAGADESANLKKQHAQKKRQETMVLCVGSLLVMVFPGFVLIRQ